MIEIKTVSYLVWMFAFTGFCSAQSITIDSLTYKDSYKKIRIFNPNDQSIASDEKVPVLIMLDGQNLFDDATSYVGEWHVDESILQLDQKIKPIVIGIDHGNADRMNELTPFPHEKYGGGGADQFLTWIIDELKPFIENKYKIEFDSERQAIAGSSLGGLFSHYSTVTRPDVFKYAGVFSPSYWFNDKIYKITNELSDGQRRYLYLSGGTKESESHVANLNLMNDSLNEKPFINSELVINENAQHNEKQWSESFPLFLNWWMDLIN
jgi:predicted alpha/beta superfamily hydrolase